MQTVRPERTRLFVEGVQTAITADLIRRRSDGLVVSQALPFLRVGTRARERDGTTVRIERVAIAMDGGVPRLLIELAHEKDDRLAAPVTAARRNDDTVESIPFGVSARRARTDSTVPYDLRSVRPSTDERTEIVIGPRVAVPVERPSFWARLLARLTALVSALGRRALPAG